jgi:plastocyanin
MLGLALIPAAAGDDCVPACDVGTQGVRGLKFAFVPPVTLVTSGSTVTWTSTDGAAHTATDGEGFCFSSGFTEHTVGRALFVIVEGALLASSEFTDMAPCTSALAMPEGGFVLPYDCLYHPDMKAVLIVR